MTIVNLSQRESPPNTPERHRNAERQQERDNRILGSPENRRMPQFQQNNAPIPFNLNIPHGYVPPLPAAQDDPFQIVNYNGRPLALTQHTAAAVRALPQLAPPLRRRGRGSSSSSVSVNFFEKFLIDLS